MKKGLTRHIWTPEQKAEIVYKHLNDHISVRALEREYHADRSMIYQLSIRVIRETHLQHFMSARIFPQ